MGYGLPFKCEKAAGGGVHFLVCTAASMDDLHIDDYPVGMYVTFWGLDCLTLESALPSI